MLIVNMKLRAILFIYFVRLVSGEGCVPRIYSNGNIVCICNSTACSYLPAITNPGTGKYVMYSSNKVGLRFDQSYGKYKKMNDLHLMSVVHINTSQQYQTIEGFGGAFTDSSGVNLVALTSDLQDKLMRAYFGPDGADYAMGRIPMGATDFSLRYYSYDDVPGDNNLTSFALQPEDFDYKIPFLKKAMQLSTHPLKFLAAPWSSPTWMKTYHKYSGCGFLLRKYYQTYADYYVKFLQAYNDQGIKIWGVSTSNEPSLGLFSPKIPAVAWTKTLMKIWLTKNLGPTIRASNFSDTKIIIHDDQTLLLIGISTYFKNNNTLQYIDGVGFHWYLNLFTPHSILKLAKTDKKPLLLLGTEASLPYGGINNIGSWGNAELYMNDILKDFKYNTNAWIDWNLVLDTNGGPVYGTNGRVTAAVLVNATNNEYLLQPMYYALAHLSKFLPPSSVRVETQLQLSTTLEVMAFKRPDGGNVLIVLNKDSSDITLHVKDEKNMGFNVDVTAQSINSILYYS